MSTASLAARAHRHRRVRKKVSGTATRPRLAVYRSNRYIYAQLVDDLSGHTLVSASSQERELRKERLTVETATKVGELLGTRATQADIKTAVFDRGGRQYHGRVQALADAARKAGLEF